MKIFNARFIGGTLVVAAGLLSLVLGFLLALPPDNNIIVGILLAVLGFIVVKAGFIIVKDTIPNQSKTEIEILRKAKLLDKNSEK